MAPVFPIAGASHPLMTHLIFRAMGTKGKKAGGGACLRWHACVIKFDALRETR